MKKILITLTVALLSTGILLAKTNSPIERVEPLSWWVGMETPLQIMVYGDAIGGYDVTLKEQNKGVAIEKVHTADSKNYIFIDVKIAADAKIGDYTFIFSDGKQKFDYKYSISERRHNSAQRESYNSSDVVYLLMPDRFANGDTTNDTTCNTQEGVKRDEPFGRHGGDLQGIIDNLDYIADLGATAIWTTPLLEDDEPEGSYHGYACSDYYHIDPRYGDNNLFRHYVKEAHKRDLKVIMDVVSNHCGIAHWWMKDLPFKNWINNIENPIFTSHAMSTHFDPNASETDLAVLEKGWFVESMPDMNLDNPFVLQYFKQWAVWWAEWSDLDGFRVDTYPYNEKVPMSEWVAAVRKEFPNISIMGECWISSPAHLAYWDGNITNRDGFTTNLPMIMDFPLRDAILAGLNSDNPGWGEGMTKVYDALSHDFLYGDPRTLLIFMGNHDTPRVADVLKKDMSRLKLATIMMATMRGVPQIFAGDELMFVSDNSDNISDHGDLRIDFPGGWEGDSINIFEAQGRTEQQSELFDFTRKLLQWRKGAEVIHNGKTKQFHSRDNAYCYFRYDDKKVVMVYINNSNESKEIDWSKYSEITDGLTTGIDIITGEEITKGNKIEVPHKSAVIIEFDR